LARNLDGKRDEGTRGYPFITPQQRFRAGDPGILGWFWLRWRRSLARSRQEERGTADRRALHVSDSREKTHVANHPGPAHAGAGRAGQCGLQVSSAQQRGKKGRPAWQASSPPAAGKLFFLHLFSKTYLK
jgi:hypothetical protein